MKTCKQVLVFLLFASVLRAQSCEIFHNCPPEAAKSLNKDSVSKPSRLPQQTVENVEGTFSDHAHALFPSIEEGNHAAPELIATAAAELKAANFRRNPTLQSDSIGVVLSGIDVVSAVEDGWPTVGMLKYAVVWRGGIWWFENVAHRDKFLKNPDQYLPAYGGHCALCIAADDAKNSDTSFQKVYQGKVYFFAKDEYKNNWLKSPDYQIRLADTKWKRVGLSSLRPTKDTPESLQIKQEMRKRQ